MLQAIDGRGVALFNVVNARGARARTQLPVQRGQLLLAPHREHFHGAIQVVAHPACDAQHLRLALHEPAKAHPLHPASHDVTPRTHRSSSRAQAQATFASLCGCSSPSSRKYRKSGSAMETPTPSSASTGSHRARTATRPRSARIKTTSTRAETNTSMPKNPPMRLAKSCSTKSRTFNPFFAAQGTNCQYGNARPMTHKSR